MYLIVFYYSYVLYQLYKAWPDLENCRAFPESRGGRLLVDVLRQVDLWNTMRARPWKPCEHRLCEIHLDNCCYIIMHLFHDVFFWWQVKASYKESDCCGVTVSGTGFSVSGSVQGKLFVLNAINGKAGPPTVLVRGKTYALISTAQNTFTVIGLWIEYAVTFIASHMRYWYFELVMLTFILMIFYRSGDSSRGHCGSCNVLRYRRGPGSSLTGGTKRA